MSAEPALLFLNISILRKRAGLSQCCVSYQHARRQQARLRRYLYGCVDFGRE